MREIKYIKSILLLTFCALTLTTVSSYTDIVRAQSAVTQVAKIQVAENTISPLSVVNNPKEFLNKKVVMNAKFDKFSTLGLDYKSAYKSSEEYISFLIKRDDTSFDIPLSEMKLFLKREEAEKHIDLKTNDEIQITGTVFSDALGDAWIDVSSITVIKKAPAKDGV